MAYTAASLSVITQSIEGSFSIFAYVTTDSLATILAAGYFADGGVRGMQEGDIIFAVISMVPYLLYVGEVLGEVCTAASFSLVLSGSALPTVNPGLGSGLLWNNGGIVCVA